MYYFPTAGQKLILDMWLDKSSSPMHALHMGFGIGSFIVPEISNPFLAVPAPTLSPSSLNSTLNSTLTPGTLATSSSPSPSLTTILSSMTVRYLKDTSIEWAYLIVSVITVVISVVFYVYQFVVRDQRLARLGSINNEVRMDRGDRERKLLATDTNRNDSRSALVIGTLKSFIKISDPGKCTGGRRAYGSFIFLFLFLYFFTAVGGERIYGKFLRTYSIDALNFNGDDATRLNTAFWISFSLGRFSGFIAAKWIPIRLLMIIEACACLVTAVLLNIFSYNNSTMLWVFSMPMGFFIAPLFPTGIAWGNFHIEMTGMAITFCLLGGGLGGMSYMWIIGYLYDHYGYRTFLYQIGGFGACAVLFAFILLFIGCGQGSRFENKIEFSETIDVDNEKA